MSLEDLGNLGDFVGGVAVIATLLYLAVQIRQNSRLLRAAGDQTTHAHSAATISLAAQSPENAAVYRKGLADPGSLSPDERAHFNLLMSATFYHFQQGFLAYQGGGQSAETWQTQLLALKFYAANIGVRDWWSRLGKQLFDEQSEFWRLVDSEIRQHDEPAA